MKNGIKFLIGLFILIVQTSFGQVYNYPECNSKTNEDVKIIKINRGDFSTTIDFEYVNRESRAIYVFLSPPNTNGAYDIRANGKNYKLLSTRGIGNADGITPAFQNKPVNFSATFEAIPKNITEFDLIEGTSGSWNFYGVQLNSNSSSSQNCDNIRYTLKSSKPDFATFLTGVKSAVITSRPKINGHVPAFDALYEYLLAMGFQSVEYRSDEYKQPRNLCEEVWVDIAFQYDLEKFYDIKMIFVNMATGYTWEFSSSKNVRAGLYSSNPKHNFGQVLRSMYGYKKGEFNSHYTMSLAKRQTCWTEAMLKKHITENGYDRIEGIYENSASASQTAKYKVAVRKIKDKYHLIYLSGAYNTSNWNEGEIKATLEPTATPNFYKAKWIMADKSENNEYYISFENGVMNVIDTDGDKNLYIKLFPTASDNIRNTPSGLAISGTGWAISSNGYIVTNYHVTGDATSLKVRGINGDFSKAYSAKIVVEDKNNDLAILKIDDVRFTSLGTIPYTISTKTADAGSNVFVLGYPLRATMGDEVKLTNGIISSRSGFQGDITSYQITAPVQSGNSGGPLFDRNGSIIGIVNAKHSGAENASYAIKASYLTNLIDLMPSPPRLQSVSSVAGKSLTEQVKILRKFTYIIEVNQ